MEQFWFVDLSIILLNFNSSILIPWQITFTTFDVHIILTKVFQVKKTIFFIVWSNFADQHYMKTVLFQNSL